MTARSTTNEVSTAIHWAINYTYLIAKCNLASLKFAQSCSSDLATQAWALMQHR
jgi:hypothetical protein